MALLSVLVIGLGELGGAVVHHLAHHKNRAKSTLFVLMRQSSITSGEQSRKQNMLDLAAKGVQVVPGDLIEESIEQLAATFGNYHTVISCSGMSLPSGTQTKVAKAALASGCARYFPWQYGIDYDVIGRDSAQDLFTEQLDVRDLLRQQSKMEWVIVSTGIFTSFIFEPAFGIVDAERNSVTALGSWENTLTTTTTNDIGKLIAEIALGHPEVHGVIFIAGDTVSMKEVADIVHRVLEKKVRRCLKTVEQLKRDLSVNTKNGILKYRVVFGEGKGVSWDKLKTFNATHCIRMQTVEEWASKHLR